MNRRGDEHPADGCNDRKERGAKLPELTAEELPSDLQADKEEKDRHETIVRPLSDREVHAESTANPVVPESQIRAGGRGVRQCQGEHRASEKDHPASLLAAKEVREQF